jgi:excisionase family DNA binding protein
VSDIRVDLYTVQEVAAMLKLSTETIRDWIRDGKIKGAIKVGKSWRRSRRVDPRDDRSVVMTLLVLGKR